MKTKKDIILIGDKVLIDPDGRHERTNAGLYLPPTVKEKEKVQCGYVVKTGPGYFVHEPGYSNEAWSSDKRKDVKYIPLQTVEGDYAIFLRDSAVEIEVDGKRYLVVPHSAILACVRTEIVEE
jgi:co-chaperonin GroES (HSP10)